MQTHTHREAILDDAPVAKAHADVRARPRRRFDLRVDIGTGLLVVLGLLVIIQLIARG